MGAVELAVLVEVLGGLEIGDGFVDAVLLLAKEGAVEVCRRVVGVEVDGAGEFFFSFVGRGWNRALPREGGGFGVGFAEVTAEDRALGFTGGGDEEVFAAAFEVASADAGEAASQPGVAEGGIDIDGFVETVDGCAGFVLGGEEKAFEGDGFGVTRGEFEAAV